VRVPGQPARRTDLTQEPALVAVVEDDAGVHLDRDRAVDRQLAGTVDHAETATPHRVDDLVAGHGDGHERRA
jgi:hypothetical protein